MEQMNRKIEKGLIAIAVCSAYFLNIPCFKPCFVFARAGLRNLRSLPQILLDLS